MAGTQAGSLKRVAGLAELPPELYQAQLAAGLRRCTACKGWKAASAFGPDRSRVDGVDRKCRPCKSAAGKAAYTPRPRTPRVVSYRPGGNKVSSQRRVNNRVRDGRYPHPNTLPCTDCGHLYAEGERRHEYDHHKGYSAEHALDVEPVCTLCHHRRGRARGTHIRLQGPNGRFIG